MQKQNFLWFTKTLAKEIFQISLISYLIFYLFEDLKKGFVSNYLNLNYLLILVIASGILSFIIFQEEKQIVPEEKRVLNSKDYLLIIFLGIAGSLIIFYKTKTLGWLSVVIATISGILIIMISVLLLKEED